VAKQATRLGSGRRVRITSSGWTAVVGASVMFAMAVQTQSVWMQVVGSALIGLLGISWLSVIRRRGGVTVSLQAPAEVTVGVPYDIQVVVRNTGHRSTAPLRIRYEVPIAPPPVARAVVYVDPVASGEKAVMSVTRVPLHRGAVQTSRLYVDAIGPFGFFTSSERIDCFPSFYAAPAAVAPIDLARALSANADGSGPMGPGLDVRGVREWRPGDDVRHVHWRSTARTGRLAVLEYGEPTVGKFGVLIAGTAADPRFEAELALAASTSFRGLDDGIIVVVAFAEAAVPNPEPFIAAKAGGRPLGVTPQGYHRIFAVLRAVVPEHSTVDALLGYVGFGGIVLLAAGDGLPFEFLSYLESAASVAGIRVLYVADYLDGVR
jgi:uncharacterized protein (DUF58 family)